MESASMSETKKQIGGTVTLAFNDELIAAAKREGFTNKWTFIVWVVKQHIDKSKRKTKRAKD
jgi:hypothetical protein